MVYSVKCVVCGLKNVDAPSISFHFFPKTEEKKRLWSNSLGLQVKLLKNNSKICSLHFKTSDYLMSTSRKVLMSNALPTLAASTTNDVEIEYCSMNTQSASPNSYPCTSSSVETVTITDLGVDVLDCSQTDDDGIDNSIVCTTSLQNESTPDVADFDKHKRDPISEDEMATPKIRKCWSSSRIGDMTHEHFSTPRKANALGSDVLENIVKDILNGKKRKFCPELRKFAVTLQYYSPRAYTYVRKTFKNLLPHPRTLRKWYTVVNGKKVKVLQSCCTACVCRIEHLGNQVFDSVINDLSDCRFFL
ncbi:uncharacterized protein LOC103309607 [Acyrthosiphon pisum]|uniref:THAP-type domain-containing protein n=1 Tax=Acyrthosiphon pisum TaxID=7029 RepID=A0A8R2B6H6_ACYPI|nr:uncharacterized protein LOC103309607 [Acyrthosiphon pisum]|eukprot:XP_008183700.1 PREDICTED: uncharacterized protein LOC103309607 [Acyrthosiphon pisum]